MRAGGPIIEIEPEEEKSSEPRVARWLVYATLIGTALIGGTIALFLLKGFFIDWLWYSSVGYQQPYAKILLTKTLLFIAAFSFGPSTALALSMFVSIGVYSAVRPRMVNQLLSGNVLGTD